MESSKEVGIPRLGRHSERLACRLHGPARHGLYDRAREQFSAVVRVTIPKLAVLATDMRIEQRRSV